jgi:uncharacterized protein (TIGR02284 family)
MAMDTSEVRTILGGLVETSRDSEKGLRNAARHIKHPEIRTLFDNYSRVRAQFAKELQAELARIGDAGTAPEPAAIPIHRGWGMLRSAIAEATDQAILEATEHGEDAAMRNYREALYKELPDDLHKSIERQYREIRQTHKHVRALRDSGWPTLYAPMAGLV